MTTEGPNSPTSAVNDATVGTITWDRPDFAKTSNNFRANVTENESGQSKYLKASNYGFSIPATATILGIMVEVEKKKVAGSTGNDKDVKIVKSDGSIGTTDKSIAGEWPTTDTYISYGGATDKWGETWTPADINNSNFGFVISVNAVTGAGEYVMVDHIRITVYYTEVVVPPPPPPEPGPVFKPSTKDDPPRITGMGFDLNNIIT